MSIRQGFTDVKHVKEAQIDFDSVKILQSHI